MNKPPSTKRVRKALSTAQKQEIITLARKRPHLTQEDIATRFSCARSTIATILKNKEKWLKEFSDGNDPNLFKRRKPQWPLLEKALVAWMEDANIHNIIVSDAILREKAKRLHAKLYPKDVKSNMPGPSNEDSIRPSDNPSNNAEADVIASFANMDSDTLLNDEQQSPFPEDKEMDDDNNDYGRFSATEGWLSRFKSRHGLKSYRLHEEAASVDVESLPAAIQDIRTKIAGYQLEDIFNAAEKGLFFRMLPNQTLATGVHEDPKTDETRVTVLLAANATGTQKLKPLIIGTAAKPLGFN
ncbi:hypothetical protein EDD21DRAFT_382367 [Dissophora ornata]|nr:hypothetical protein EDD21DRAFT_382367 [Dissophora ornata]